MVVRFLLLWFPPGTRKSTDLILDEHRFPGMVRNRDESSPSSLHGTALDFEYFATNNQRPNRCRPPSRRSRSTTTAALLAREEAGTATPLVPVARLQPPG